VVRALVDDEGVVVQRRVVEPDVVEGQREEVLGAELQLLLARVLRDVEEDRRSLLEVLELHQLDAVGDAQAAGGGGGGRREEHERRERRTDASVEVAGHVKGPGKEGVGEGGTHQKSTERTSAASRVSITFVLCGCRS